MSRRSQQMTAERRRPKRLRLSAALPFWVVASVAGWAVVAGLFAFGVGRDDPSRLAEQENLRTILEFAPAAGPQSAETDAK